MITFDALQIIFSLFVLHSHSHSPTHLNKHPTKFCNFIQQERGNLSPKKQKKSNAAVPEQRRERGDPDQLGERGR